MEIPSETTPVGVGIEFKTVWKNVEDYRAIVSFSYYKFYRGQMKKKLLVDLKMVSW